MVNIIEITDPELAEKITYHEKIGGALRISVYKILENYLGKKPEEYIAHLVTARQTLEKQNYDWNKHWNKFAGQEIIKNPKYATTNYQQLDQSGIKIDWRQFLGPHYDCENNKPLIRGRLRNETLNAYFYYDQEELLQNKVDINKLVTDYENLYPENKGFFINALMEPPYNLSNSKEILKRGEYVLSFLEYFFGDLKKCIIYAWDTKCSIVFDAGNEWWGSYFWTIYNPEKEWYVGIIASETD